MRWGFPQRIFLNINPYLSLKIMTMERRNFLKSVTAAGLTGTLLTSCASSVEEEAKSTNTIAKGSILHSVYFWLKEDVSDEEEQDFLNFFAEIRNVPGV